MVVGSKYAFKRATLAISVVDGHNVPMTLPVGGVVEMVDADLNGNRLVDALWDGNRIMIFTTDVRERGELVRTARLRVGVGSHLNQI